MFASTSTMAPTGLSFGARLRRLAVASFDAWFDWAECVRQRRNLAELDDRMLLDIGLTRAEVERVVRRSCPR